MARKTKISKHGSDNKPDKRNNISSSAPPAEEEYRVGPGRPPKEYTWKPGRRPAGARMARTHPHCHGSGRWIRVRRHNVYVAYENRQKDHRCPLLGPRFFGLARAIAPHQHDGGDNG